MVTPLQEGGNLLGDHTLACIDEVDLVNGHVMRINESRNRGIVMYRVGHEIWTRFPSVRQAQSKPRHISSDPDDGSVRSALVVPAGVPGDPLSRPVIPFDGVTLGQDGHLATVPVSGRPMGP